MLSGSRDAQMRRTLYTTLWRRQCPVRPFGHSNQARCNRRGQGKPIWAIQNYLIRGERQRKACGFSSRLTRMSRKAPHWLTSPVGSISVRGNSKSSSLLERLDGYASSPLLETEIARLRGFTLLMLDEAESAREEFDRAHGLCPEDRTGQRIALRGWANLAQSIASSSSREGAP